MSWRCRLTSCCLWLFNSDLRLSICPEPKQPSILVSRIQSHNHKLQPFKGFDIASRKECSKNHTRQWDKVELRVQQKLFLA